MPDAVKRRLTTILCADVKGYSRLMDADEVATLSTLKEYREAITGFVARHEVRVVNMSGDSMLAEFGSVVEAVQCAAEVQRELAVRNGNLSNDRRMEFRIGINLGDVIVEGDDIYGEGVNIAARLEGLAEPGGICISGTVYDQVKNKLTLGYEFLGPQNVKNISDDVPVYRVALDGSAATTEQRGTDRAARSPGGDDKAHAKFRRSAARMSIIVGFLFLINVITSFGSWWFVWPALGIGCYLAFRWVSVYGGEHRRGRGRHGDVEINVSGGDRRRGRHARGLRFGNISGDVTFDRDMRVVGNIEGSVRVTDRVSLKMTGNIQGDLTIGRDAVVWMTGNILGDVADEGGALHLIGKVAGRQRRVEAGESPA